MRQRYCPQSDFDVLPIEKIQLPARSRDELPAILAALQWIWMHPTLKAEIFALLDRKILAGKKATGRNGMDLWQILVLGVVRLGWTPIGIGSNTLPTTTASCDRCWACRR
jgi:transposase, IS5 family